MLAMFISQILFSALAHGQTPAEPTVTISQPKLFCSVEQFTLRKGKGSLKACDKLKDQQAAEVKTNEGCKQRAVEKAKDCMKLAADAEQIAVKARYIEKFDIRQNAVSFTCELDKSGGSACP